MSRSSVLQSRLRLLAVSAISLSLLSARLSSAAGSIDFNRDIRPILSENCFYCHGPDKNHREADLRLDDRDIAVKMTAIVPGKADESSLVTRIESTDPDDQMPPPDSRKRLTDEQKKLLRQWIDEGAVYKQHWAYEPPVKPSAGSQESGVTSQNEIDLLVTDRLKKAGLAMSPEADRRTLVRRLHFDLVGIPPTPEQVDTFENDTSAGAYEQLVDRLLASPHYGERMAMGWLDVVRFADTIGYHSDNPRNVWPYRDYVIRSFNENKRFDQFTIEQLAGDLLPDSTQEQQVASAFNRLLLTTEEGGAQAKDYEARMLTDRVRAMGTVWLGQTLGCCQCHDHKYDPATSRDFYSMGAFFADIEEPIIGAREPGMLVTKADEASKLAQLRSEAAELRKQYDAMTPELTAAEEAWEKTVLEEAADADRAQPLKPAQASAASETNPSASASDKPAQSPQTKIPPQEIVELIRVGRDQRKPDQHAKLIAHFKSQLPELADLRGKTAAAEKAAAEFETSLPRCLISKSLAKPRIVRILPRGNWMDENGPIVSPAVPQYLPQPKVEGDRRLTRLDLARWVVSRDNPLTARVFVNRLWKQFFGIGLSKTADDIGSQGEWPVNPELLDWLACELMDRGWNVQHVVRKIVVSQTYRQVSTASPQLQARDPDNRLLARQSRFRLEAELVRDNALAISGLLVPAIGGPSVKPYQPEGYWENLNFPVRNYNEDKGSNQHRRGLYTWWQRSFVHPSMLAFDAPTREECAADRSRSNIPQQALVLLNDPTYVEAARAFAGRIVKEGGADPSARIRWAWRQALGRLPRDDEAPSALAVLEKHRAQYAADPNTANELLKVGQASLPEQADAIELAAWTNVARIVLNLHETITRN